MPPQPRRTTPGPVRLDRLTSLRFAAALLVLLHHATRDLVPVPLLSPFLVQGTVGVGFFFALSGFVLAWSARPDDAPRRFYRRRAARVLPLHLVTWVAALAVLAALDRGVGLGPALASLLLVQAWSPDTAVHYAANAPSWSLSCELLFYAVFPLLLGPLTRLPRARLPVVLAGLGAAYVGFAVGLGAAAGDATWALYLLPPFRLLGFLAGVVLALLLRAGGRAPCRLPAAAAVVAAVYCASAAVAGLLGAFELGVADAVLLPAWLLLIAAAATDDVDGRPGLLRSAWAVRLGEWSFALYLTHWLLLQAWARLDVAAPDRALPLRLAELVAFVLVAVALSGLAYTGVERPLERRLRVRRAPAADRRTAPPAQGGPRLPAQPGRTAATSSRATASASA